VPVGNRGFADSAVCGCRKELTIELKVLAGNSLPSSPETSSSDSAEEIEEVEPTSKKENRRISL